MSPSKHNAVCFAVVLLLISSFVSGQKAGPATIHVQFDHPQGALPPVWNFFGYDEPNYTYAPNGKKLLGEIAGLSSKPVYIRVHNLLTNGEGSASLMWGSTYAYSEDT